MLLTIVVVVVVVVCACVCVCVQRWSWCLPTRGVDRGCWESPSDSALSKELLRTYGTSW